MSRQGAKSARKIEKRERNVHVGMAANISPASQLNRSSTLGHGYVFSMHFLGALGALAAHPVLR